MRRAIDERDLPPEVLLHTHGPHPRRFSGVSSGGSPVPRASRSSSSPLRGCGRSTWSGTGKAGLDHRPAVAVSSGRLADGGWGSVCGPARWCGRAGPGRPARPASSLCVPVGGSYHRAWLATPVPPQRARCRGRRCWSGCSWSPRRGLRRSMRRTTCSDDRRSAGAAARRGRGGRAHLGGWAARLDGGLRWRRVGVHAADVRAAPAARRRGRAPSAPVPIRDGLGW